MAAHGKEKIEIVTDAGERAEAFAPVIVSASRSTDIPAFHAPWLAHRLARGHAARVNPFTHTRQYVTFARARAFVFWSKNPAPLLPFLPEWDRRGLGYYVQFSLNDYEAEGLEPHLPPLAERVATFRRLSGRLGPERVVWRFDPLLLAGDLTPARLLERVQRVGDRLAGATRKLIFSFADVAGYAKVRANLARTGVAWRDFRPEEMEETARRIAALCRDWGMEAATCAEPHDFSAWGAPPGRCIDGDLLARLFPHDRALLAFLGLAGDEPPGLFGPGASARVSPRLKDKGQRKDCGCIVSTDIGCYDTCPHFCAYCYANTSRRAVEENLRRADPCAEAIRE